MEGNQQQQQVVDSAYGTTRSVKKVYLWTDAAHSYYLCVSDALSGPTEPHTLVKKAYLWTLRVNDALSGLETVMHSLDISQWCTLLTWISVSFCIWVSDAFWKWVSDVFLDVSQGCTLRAWVIAVLSQHESVMHSLDISQWCTLWTLVSDALSGHCQWCTLDMILKKLSAPKDAFSVFFTQSKQIFYSHGSLLLRTAL
jgi:hypothetical protein